MARNPFLNKTFNWNKTKKIRNSVFALKVWWLLKITNKCRHDINKISLAEGYLANLEQASNLRPVFHDWRHHLALNKCEWWASQITRKSVEASHPFLVETSSSEINLKLFLNFWTFAVDDFHNRWSFLIEKTECGARENRKRTKLEHKKKEQRQKRDIEPSKRRSQNW